MFRRTLAAMVLALGLAACQQGGAAAGGPAMSTSSSAAIGDMAMGPANAKVTLVEYASHSCGHCAQFAIDELPKIKAKYVLTNKVRFVFREFPTPPRDVAIGAALVARCKGGKKYFEITDNVFRRQRAIFTAMSTPGGARQLLLDISREAGITEAEFNACLSDQSAIDAIQERITEAESKYKINSTPTFVLNGVVVPREDSTAAGLEKRIEALLAAQ